jgi:hypothetical protein
LGDVSAGNGSGMELWDPSKVSLAGAGMPAVATTCSVCSKKLRKIYFHPDLNVALCKKCADVVAVQVPKVGDDNHDDKCTWCRDGENLLCCSKCTRTICNTCNER